MHPEHQPSGSSQVVDSHRSFQQGSLGKAARLFLAWTAFQFMDRSDSNVGNGVISAEGTTVRTGARVLPRSTGGCPVPPLFTRCALA